MGIGRFIAGVGVLIRHEVTGRYLLLKRSGDKDFASGVWECVTGRVNQGEGFEDAAHREVSEELGLKDLYFEYILGTTHFYRGQSNPDNELVGVIYLASMNDSHSIQLSHEHTAYQWFAADELYDFLGEDTLSTRWIRGVIERVEAVRPLLTQELQDFNQRHGFELG